MGLQWEVLFLRETVFIIYIYLYFKYIWCQILPRFFPSFFVGFLWMSVENNGKALFTFYTGGMGAPISLAMRESL